MAGRVTWPDGGEDEEASPQTRARRLDSAMDEIDLTAEDIELTTEQIVAADTAMLLDLGGAEELAELIATQTLGVGDTVADRKSPLDVELDTVTSE